jgi:hypothetical protein
MHRMGDDTQMHASGVEINKDQICIAWGDGIPSSTTDVHTQVHAQVMVPEPDKWLVLTCILTCNRFIVTQFDPLT